MDALPATVLRVGETPVSATARCLAEEALAEAVGLWSSPRPDTVVTAARRYLAAVEDWADARREGA